MKKGTERYPSSFSHLKQPSLVSLVDLLKKEMSQTPTAPSHLCDKMHKIHTAA